MKTKENPKDSVSKSACFGRTVGGISISMKIYEIKFESLEWERKWFGDWGPLLGLIYGCV